MNTPRKGMPPGPVDEHDWQVQESAISAATDRRDALLARALRSMPVSQPPAGFAASVARLAVAGAPIVAPAKEPKLDRVLLDILVVVFAVSAIVVVAIYGREWLAMSGEAIGSNATLWALAGAACLGLSWAMGGVRRLFESLHPAISS